MAGRARQGIDQAIDEMLCGARQLRVFPPHRINAEWLASKHLRDVVRIEAGGIHYRARAEELARRLQLELSTTPFTSFEPGGRQHQHTAVVAIACQSPDQRLRLHHAGAR